MYLQNPFLILASVCLLIALASFVVLKKNKRLRMKTRLGLIYLHIFSLVFPFAFYALFEGCQRIILSCDRTEQIAYLFLITAGISFVIGLVSAPFIFLKRHKKISVPVTDDRLLRFLDKYSSMLDIDTPQFYFIDAAKPSAFSVRYLKASIFMSVGLVELLSKKEVEAVLLHELAHVKNRSPMNKLAINLFRWVSPLARFTTLHRELDREERKADAFAARVQGTDRYVLSAKKKVNEFYSFE